MTHEVGARTQTLMDIVLNRLAGHGTQAHPVWLPPLTESPALDVLIRRRWSGWSADGADRPGRLPVRSAPRCVDSRLGRRGRPCRGRGRTAVGQVDGAAHVGDGGRRHPRPVGRPVLLPGLRRWCAVVIAATCRTSDRWRDGPTSTCAGARSRKWNRCVRAREARFRRLGIESMTDYRQLRSAGDSAVTDDPYGDVFLVIDGWATLRQDFDNLEPAVIAIAAQGLSFGVHVVVTASRWAEIRPALKDQIGTRIELRLGDPADSEMDRRRARQLSGIAAGARHHTRRERDADRTAASGRAGGRPTDGPDAVRVRSNSCRCRLLTTPSPRQVHVRTATQVAVGLGERELQPVVLDFAEQSHLVVLGDAECGKTSALRLLCREIVRTNDRRLRADRDRRLPPDAARCRRVRPPRRLCDIGFRADSPGARPSRTVAGTDARRGR